MGIGVLGPLQVDGAAATLGPRDRVVLQALAVTPGVPVRADTLAEALWGDDVPPSWAKVVQGCIVRLRKSLGADTIETTPHGYLLVHHTDHLDHLRFAGLVDRARELVAAREPERAAYVLREALALWRGDPFAELVDWAPGRVASERLVELRLEADELLVEAELLAGHHRQALAPAQRAVHEAPLRERRWGLLALALYQDGRQAEALAALSQARRVLLDELGLDLGPDLVALEQAILNQDPALAVSAAIPEPSVECPYLGLVAYGIEDSTTFFGREEVTEACLRRLDDWDVLAVVGPSGCGKSSLVRAGVAAALERDGLRVHVVTPGAHPVAALAAAPSRPGSVLVVDQCEEALALDEGSPERTEFFDALLGYAQDHQLVLTLRADRLGELSSHPDFARLVEQGLYLLGPMTEPELRRAIEGPAAQAGLRLEPGLVDLLVREVSGQPAALPLLSHVLRQTWKRREGTTLTVEGYAATGGVREAVAQSAEDVFRNLDAEHQAMLRDLMLRLVAPDEGGDPVRTRVPRRSVVGDAEHARLVEQLVGARLLASDGDTVEIAHESLAVAWPRLRSWLDEDVEGLRVMRHLAVAAESWDELGRPDSELYRGSRQVRAAEWEQRTAPSLTEVERDFLDASASLAENEQRVTEEQVRRERQLNRRLRLGLAGTAFLLAAAILLGTVAQTSAQRADQQALAADARRLGAEALRAVDPDRAVLLAAAGLRLQDSVDTRSDLLATLERTPQLVTSYRNGPIVTMAVNNTTGEIATAATELRLHDASTLRELRAPAAPGGAYITASADGRHFALGSDDQQLASSRDRPAVLLLDGTGAPAATQLGGLPVGRYAGRDLSFSPNSRWFAATLLDAAGQRPAALAVWDLQHPAKPVATTDPGEQSHRPVVSANGRTLYSIGSGQLRVTSLPGGVVRRLVQPADLGVRDLSDALALSPDGRTLAVVGGSEVVLLDTSTLAPRAYLPGAEDADSVVFSRDGHRVATAGAHLVAWDVSTGEPRVLIEQAVEADKAAFSPDGRTVYSAGLAGALSSWDLDGSRSWLTTRLAPLTSGGAVVTRFSPDGRKVVYVFADPPAMQVRDVASGVLGARIRVNQPERDYIDVAWSPDSKVLNATTGDSRVATWDATTGRLLAEHRIDADGSALGPAGGIQEGASIAFFSHDGRYLLVGSTTGRLHVLDARTLDLVRPPIEVPRKPGSKEPLAIARLEPSPHDHTAVARNIDLVDYTTGRVGTRLDMLPEDSGVTYSPDGRRLFVVTSSGEVGLLDTRSRRWLSPLTATQRFPAYIVRFSADGSQVAAIASGRAGRWDGHTGAYLGAVSVPEDGAVTFAPGGQALMIAPGGGPLLSWDLRPATWLAAACRMAGRDLSKDEWRLYLPDRPFRRICQT
jgi:WD40 repeat protein/DNA-binding SARP family transcriptional activator